MDSTHFVHSKRAAIVHQRIDEGTIGKVKGAAAVFSFTACLPGNIRADPTLEPMTALGDLG